VALAEAIAARTGSFSIALSGGSTPKLAYSLMAAEPLVKRMPWSKTKIFFGDERYVKHDHPDSNFRMATEAMLKTAPILILDEPTSSLDSISEEIVFAALRRLRAGRTTIAIAHRRSTVRDADRILVLDGGEIAAQGRHEELLKSSQLYRRMCARLSVGKSLDEPESVDELIEAAKR